MVGFAGAEDLRPLTDFEMTVEEVFWARVVPLEVLVLPKTKDAAFGEKPQARDHRLLEITIGTSHYTHNRTFYLSLRRF